MLTLANLELSNEGRRVVYLNGKSEEENETLFDDLLSLHNMTGKWKAIPGECFVTHDPLINGTTLKPILSFSRGSKESTELIFYSSSICCTCKKECKKASQCDHTVCSECFKKYNDECLLCHYVPID